MLQYVQNEQAGTITVQQDGSTVAGIARDGDAFVVAPATGIAFVEGRFSDLARAKQYVAEQIGENIPSASKSKRSESPAKEKRARTVKIAASKSATPAPILKASKAKRTDAPAKVQRVVKVSEVMQRNLAEIAAGNLEVFVGEPETLDLIRSKYRKLVDAGYAYKNGSANIYPTPAQAKRIALLVPGTDTAIQCTLGGYHPWRKSLRKRSTVATTAA